MSAKHTPGPWMPGCKSHGASCRHPAIMSDDGQVAIAAWQGSEAATDANARLIAAAPELLKALQALTHSLDYADLLHDDQRKAFKHARDAIAKAGGAV